MTERENLLRAIRFERPERIPTRFSISPACWRHYEQPALEELMASHRLLFPDYSPLPRPHMPELPPWQVAGREYTDDWGCVWQTAEDGITGAVVRHPIEDWAALENFRPPDPRTSWGLAARDWEQHARDMAAAKARGRVARDGLRHGHTFLTLTYLRGYEPLIFDMADEEPRLWKLIAMVEEFNLANVRSLLASGVDVINYPEDLGMQQGPMLSPAQFEKYIRPSYRRLMAPAREAGVAIHMHSDGDIRELADYLVEGGVAALNLQDLVNGVDWIAARLKGRVCIDLDIDRQKVTRYGSPAEVEALVREEVTKLGSPEGGLMLTYGLYPGVPLENARALMDALERYAGHFAG